MRYRKPLYLYLAASVAAVVLSAVGSMESSRSPGPVIHANGFTLPLEEGNSGPYNYLVGIWPAEPVAGATVGVRGRIGSKGHLSAPVPAPGAFLQPWSYELDMRVREPGRWTFEIQIDSSLGETALEVPLEVAAASSAGTSGEPGNGTVHKVAAGMDWILGSAALAVIALASGGWVFIRRQLAKCGTNRARQSKPDRRRRRR